MPRAADGSRSGATTPSSAPLLAEPMTGEVSVPSHDAHDADENARELVFAPSGPDDPRGHADSVIVRRTQVTGPGGHPVYCDETGIVRAEISDADEVRMLVRSVHQDPRRPVACRRLPPRPAAA